MIKIKYITGYISVILLFVACKTDNMEDENNIATSLNTKSSDSNLIVNEKDFEEFIKDNDLKLIATFPGKDNAARSSYNFGHVKEKITSSHLVELGLSEQKIITMVREKMRNGGAIDGVTINDYKTSRAYSKSNLADQYGWWAYIETGDPIITPIKNLKKNDVKVLMSGTEVTAGTSGNPNYEKSIEYTQESVVKNTIEVNVGLKVGAKLGIWGQDINTEIGLENKNGSSVETREAQKLTEKISYSIPANKKIAIYMIQTMKKREIRYEIPLSITGNIALNYSQPIEGSYFLGVPADILLQGKKKQQVGTISQELYTDVKVFVKELQMNERAPSIKEVFNLN
ncbi:hypothetical protein [Chryseobacterium potabilaquae]|uniref:Uncharacterized protein n=1 Tax=Chryseobacterium potabilaquae TaxID=2675057 RepID=A0A6N4X669_9FLAO|nr:hypothetical protein [Chryseobacterium potabilaquae]CAA7193629.1 hypothetical protein CHRY9293_00041 [Chryseobacterium potabilaquae]